MEKIVKTITKYKVSNGKEFFTIAAANAFERELAYQDISISDVKNIVYDLSLIFLHRKLHFPEIESPLIIYNKQVHDRTPTYRKILSNEGLWKACMDILRESIIHDYDKRLNKIRNHILVTNNYTAAYGFLTTIELENSNEERKISIEVEKEDMSIKVYAG